MILYFSYAGRIKQRILCCRKFIIMFGSSDLFIEQLLALAECRLLKFSFRAWQKYCILSLLSLDRFSEGILINISSKKNAFVRVFTLTILWLSAILKLDFLKSPGKSGSARPPQGVKLDILLYIQLTISFLIGRKRSVNFRNQRLGISKDNHVKFARYVLLTVSEEAKTWLPGLLRWLSKTEKIVEDKTHKTQKGRRRWQRSCLLITWKRKNWENLRFFFHV